jgi:hypothetical protein
MESIFTVQTIRKLERKINEIKICIVIEKCTEFYFAKIMHNFLLIILFFFQVSL